MGLSGGGDIGVVALLGLVGGMRGYRRHHGFCPKQLVRGNKGSN